MNKKLALAFALLSVACMCATGVAISFSAWAAIGFGLLTLAVTGAGFVVKARLRRKGAAG